MVAEIPSSITHVQATDEGNMIVYDDEFLVVSPVESHVTKILEDIVVRMSHDMNISMARRTLRAQGAQSVFSVCRITGQGL